MSGVPVVSPAERYGSVVYNELNNVTNTRQAVTPPANCIGVEIHYMDPAANSTGRALRIVINAASDADANSKIGVAGARAFCPRLDVFREFRAGNTDYITRVDIMTDVAESGTNRIFFVFKSE